MMSNKSGYGFDFRYVLGLFLLLSGYVNGQEIDRKAQEYRPMYHFSPAKGWMGDPDGLVHYNNTYHLFWWGHAVSKDLVHWQEMPRPMKEGMGFSYFSGSVVVDKMNTGGFGKNSMIAFYTKHLPGDSLPETQAISISNNEGKSFDYYQKNPILDINKVFFRDPQVFWYEQDKSWKMVVSRPDVQQVHIYQSSDLKNWAFCSSFEGLGAKNSFWECPDLFELPIEGSNEKKWVLIIGRGPNRVQYFVGDFNGKTFVTDKKIAEYLSVGQGIKGSVFEDFEGKNSKWPKFPEEHENKASGVADYLGKHYLSTANASATVFRSKSQPFTISAKAINFLLMGGNHPDSTCINLLVDGQVVRTTSGDNTKVFKWNGWDVRPWIGKKAQLELVDLSKDTTIGFIAIDHITFSDQLSNQHLEHALWLDDGPDYYATRTWRDYDKSSGPADTVHAIGWMGNWDYARKAPSKWGKGFQSVPRMMTLREMPSGWRVFQQPIPQLAQLRDSGIHQQLQLKGVQTLKNFKPEVNSYELDATFTPGTAKAFGLNLFVGEGRKLALRYDPQLGELTLDRRNCTNFNTDTAFTKSFAKKYAVPLALDKGSLRLHIFVDRSSIEIFANDGEKVVSATTFAADTQLGLETFSDDGNTTLNIQAWKLKSIW
ncbi:glycoside hydrolase family 32 protein [Pedobacter psychrotolerans]|uniref:glycoside hydrolase family 32 protein n=1 Tax=Pedobacter psychrotolerans TaxID=1843235 RepID=UPI003F9B457B